MSVNTLPFWKNKILISCEKKHFLDVLKEAISPAPSLQSNLPKANIDPEQLSGTVDGNKVFLTSGRSRNWSWLMILRGMVIEGAGDTCEIHYRFVPCIPFCFTIIVLNYWVIDVKATGEELMKMLVLLMVINFTFLCICISQSGRIQRLLESIIREACSVQTNRDSGDSTIDPD